MGLRLTIESGLSHFIGSKSIDYDFVWEMFNSKFDDNNVTKIEGDELVRICKFIKEHIEFLLSKRKELIEEKSTRVLQKSILDQLMILNFNDDTDKKIFYLDSIYKLFSMAVKNNEFVEIKVAEFEEQ